MRLPSGNFLDTLMVVFDHPSHRSAQWNSSRTEHMQAVHANRPHRRPGELMKVRMVMRIMSIHDALQGALLRNGMSTILNSVRLICNVTDDPSALRQQSSLFTTPNIWANTFCIVSFGGFVKACSGKTFPKWN